MIPQLSIIIPYYNEPRALENLLQTIPNNQYIQIIVIDDNSTLYKNEFAILVKRYGHIEFFCNNSGNKGAGACRNIGLSKVKSEWVMFADSDDLFVDGFFSIISKYLQNTDTEVVYFIPTSKVSETNELSKRHIVFEQLVMHYLLTKDKVSELKLRYWYVVPWSKLYRRAFLINNHIQFDEILASNDVMFSIKVGYYMNKFHVSNECIYCVIDRRDSLTKNTSKEIYYIRLTTHINTSNFLRKHLSIQDYKLVRIGGRGYLKVALKNRLGFRVFLKTLLLLIKNQIPLIYLADFNLIRILKINNKQ